MIRALIITVLLLFSAAWLTFSGTGYSRAGDSYILETGEERKTITPLPDRGVFR